MNYSDQLLVWLKRVRPSLRSDVHKYAEDAIRDWRRTERTIIAQWIHVR